jgi:peptide/nickel transport system permease protein
VTSFIIRRLLQALLVLFIASVIVFFAMRFLPGDPLLIFISKNNYQGMSPEQMQILRHEFGLDKSLPVQYANWIGGMFRGDFGISLTYQEKVGKLLAESVPISFYIGILTLVVYSVIGTFGGIIAAVRRGKWLDTVTTVSANIGITIPTFWLGILMIYFFSLKLNWLPSNGYTSPFQDFWLSFRQVIMPVICLSLVPLASVTRQTRSSMLEIINQDYIRTAWSKGLKEREVVLRHTLKNGLIPVVTLIGMTVPFIFSGAVLIETIFNIPGLGRLLVNAVFARDLAVVQAGCLIIAVIVVFTNLLVDISYGWLDPRIRYS